MVTFEICASRIGAKLIVTFALLFGLAVGGFASEEGDLYIGDTINMEPFVVFAGTMDVIDGITGRDYNGDSAVVWNFVATFKDDLIRYHKRLLHYEIQHMNLRIKAGLAMEKELKALMETFGIDGFQADRTQWLTRERSILYRLNTKPFFRIKALIVWDRDQLDRMRPELPDTKYAKDIRFNEETQKWERRVLTKWEVYYQHYNERNGRSWPVNVVKYDGLNLDTNRGFHIIGNGLTNQVPPKAFQEVQITYPIFINSEEPPDEQVKRLRETYIDNLRYIYDPFTWVARRQTRFRGGFAREATEYVSRKRFPVKDREWFNEVFARLLNDVAQIKVLGVDEIYDLQAEQRWRLSKNVLGEGLDLLNWHKGEKRAGEDIHPDAKIWINFDKPQGARFIVLDAYMRYTDKFLDAVRTRLLEPKKKMTGQQLIKEAIEEASGVPFDKYFKAARKAQIELLEKHR